jgi:hypothetical protein
VLELLHLPFSSEIASHHALSHFLARVNAACAHLNGCWQRFWVRPAGLPGAGQAACSAQALLLCSEALALRSLLSIMLATWMRR